VKANFEQRFLGEERLYVGNDKSGFDQIYLLKTVYCVCGTFYGSALWSNHNWKTRNHNMQDFGRVFI